MELRPNTSYPKSDPRYHTANVLSALDDLIRHLRETLANSMSPRRRRCSKPAPKCWAGCAPRSSIMKRERKRQCANRAGTSLHHAVVARPCQGADVAEPWTTVKASFSTPSRRSTCFAN
jgi:hypothetical protein